MGGVTPGWYTGYVYGVYDANHQNTVKTEKQAKKDLSNKVAYLADNPSIANRYIREKLLSTWADPMFESIFCGPNQGIYTEVSNNYTKKQVKQNLYYKEVIFLNIVMIGLTVFTLLNLIFGFKWDNDYRTFIVLFLIGGFIFHFLWETKSQYTFQYIYCLIPLAASMCTKYSELIEEKLKKLLNRKRA